jgi:hypothetical protein
MIKYSSKRREIDMARWLDAIGEAVDSPEAAWDALAQHKAVRLAGIALGLIAFSRLVTIILDVHRLAFTASFDERTVEIVFGTLARGSIWHSFVIAACGISVVLATCAFTTIAITMAGKRAPSAQVFIELVTATTIRLPIIVGITVIGLFLTGTVYVVEFTVPLCIWISGFAVALLETWRASGKVAARHEARPRVGILAALVTSVLMTALAVGIIYLIGGFD